MKTTLKSTLAALSFAILAVITLSGCAGIRGGSGDYHRAWSGNGPHGGNIGH